MRLVEIGHLIRMELTLDLRQKQAVGGMLLYVVSAIYVCYLAFKQVIGLDLWNALFWLIMLFAAFNALARSFQREDPGRQLYLYTLADPRSVILSMAIGSARPDGTGRPSSIFGQKHQGRGLHDNFG